tara:strand:+ start:605 stop:841 length:237 start_codon:yes stop_codon:yes gene_type:complete
MHLVITIGEKSIRWSFNPDNGDSVREGGEPHNDNVDATVESLKAQFPGSSYEILEGWKKLDEKGDDGGITAAYNYTQT